MNGIDMTGLGSLDLSEWERLWSGLAEGARLGFSSVGEFIASIARGEAALPGGSVLLALKEAALAAFGEAFGGYAALIAVALISALMNMLSRDGDGLSGAAGFMCFGMSAAAVSYNLAKLVAIAAGAIDELSRCMEIATPVMTAALAATGSAGTSALMSPLTAFLNLAVTGVFKDIVLPLSSASGIAAIIGVLSESGGFSQLFGLIKSAVKWVTGAVFTVYFGIVSIQGMTVARADGIAIRTAKYTLDKSVPVVGGAVSGTLDTLLASASVIKNAAGAAAVVTAALAVCSPLLYIACSSFACKAAAALSEPLGDKRIPGLLSKLSEICSLLFAAVITVAVMFMITAGLAIAAGNP